MSPSDRTLLENSLDQVGRGDATPSEATTAIRRALSADPPLADRVYDALRDVTWRTLTSRSFGPELNLWFEVFRHAAALLGKNSGGIADKLRAHADLISQSARFAELQPIDELLGRKHTKPLLAALASAGKAVRNSALRSILGLEESNLSRVTGALSGRGLIERSSSGKEANFSLTELGRQAARKLDIVVNDSARDDRAWWNDAPYALAVWEMDGKPVGANAAFHSLTNSREPQELPALPDWRLEMSRTARAERMLSKDTWQLEIGESRWIQFAERSAPDGRLCILATDLSVSMETINRVENELKIVRETEARLRRELADAESRVAAYRTAHSHIRDEIMSVAARSNEQVRNTIGIWHQHIAWEEPAVPVALQQVERNLGAMQIVMRNLFDPVDIVENEPAKWDWLDPRQMIVEAVDAASVLDPNVAATYSFGNMARVRGAAFPIRVALTHLLILGMKNGAYAVHGALKGSNLVATLRAKGPAVRYTGHFDTVTSMGLGYCQAVVKTHGGALEVEETESDAMIRLSFPVETKAHVGGFRVGSHTPKPGKPRKAGVRSSK